MKTMKRSLSTRLSVYIVASVTTLFALSFAIYYVYAERTIKKAAYEKSELEVNHIVSTIDLKLALIEQSINDVVLSATNSLGDYELMNEIICDVVQKNPLIYGVSLAFEPGYFPDKGEYFSPYAYRDESGEIKVYTYGDDDYDYCATEWYRTPKSTNKEYWSEPYLDEILMTTYTVPFYDKENKFIGVILADVSLELLTELVVSMKPYENSYAIMISRNGYYLAHNDSSQILQKSFFADPQELDENSSHDEIHEMGVDMMSLNSGSANILINGEQYYTLYAPIKRAGWSVATASLESDVMSGLYSMSVVVWSVLFIGLVVIFLFVWLVVKRITLPLKKFTGTTSVIAQGNFDAPIPEVTTRDEVYDLREAFVNMQHSLKLYIDELHATTKARERIESELEIATTIQMGMLPTIFPPHPNLSGVDICATLIPAKEVGGDLYDFFKRNGKLYFTVGDASGKGVPASLLMAITSSLFRSVAEHIDDPAQILFNINNTIAETNEANMFITLFVGMLDLDTGEMVYSSAGHNAPVLLSGGESRFIDVEPALPLGAMSGIEYSNSQMVIDRKDTLLLYSDGLTEAENADKELYSDERLLERMASISSGSNASTVIDEIKCSVDLFVGGNEQSDDLTMLALKLIDK